MEELSSFNEVKREHEFKKSLGQNFIADPNLLLSIARDAGVNNGSVVVEVGAGAGTLTSVLAKQAKAVLSFEVDNSLKERLGIIEKENSNLKFVFKDILNVTEEEIELYLKENFNETGTYQVVANIPYYITSPIIIKFLLAKKVTSIMVMVQKEVAERITSKPKTKEYGAISVLVQALSTAKLVRVVKRHNFYPAPKVDSALLKIDKKETGFSEEEIKKLSLFIQKCFLARRKTLVNNLMMGYNLSRQNAEKVLENAGIKPTVRPEELTPEDYINLVKYI